MKKNRLDLAEALMLLLEEGNLCISLQYDYSDKENYYNITLNGVSPDDVYKMLAPYSPSGLTQAVIYMANNLDKLKLN